MMIRQELGRLALAVAFLLSAGGCQPQAPSPPPGHGTFPSGQELQAAIEQVVENGLPSFDVGISAAVIVPGYEPWVGAAGQSHQGTPVSPDMLFNMGSIAKTFEAALALKLAEEGQLDLDRTTGDWLPAYGKVDASITVRQLLNHTSGVFNVFEHPDFPWVGQHVDYGRRWQIEEVLSAFALEPYGPPGSVQHYSSTNYLLLTAILEEAGGAPVEDQVDRRFFRPLGLESSFISMGDLPPAPFTVAHPWVDVDFDGQLDDLSGVPQTWIASLTHPVLFATPRDMAAWTQALFHNGRVLSETSLGEMLTIPQNVLPDPEGRRFGLGVEDFSVLLGTAAIGHAGTALGHSSAALYLPEQGVSLAWSINLAESPPGVAEDLMWAAWARISEVLLKARDQGHSQP